MKKFILSTLIILCVIASFGQSYNNEWIDYSKTYYKFKVGNPALTNGLYRIDQSTLAGVGLAGANAEDFQLWRNGSVVPIYTSVSTGPLPANGFIEFYGEVNDGRPDKPLYRNPDYQLSDKWSLASDTATYFLTLNPGGANAHYIQDANNVAANSRIPESFFMYKTGNYFRNKLNPGFAAIVGAESVYSSAYDMGEGLTSGDIFGGGTNTFTFTNLFADPTGPDMTFNIAASGNSKTLRSFQVKINGTLILNQTMDYFDYSRASQSAIPASLVSTNSAAIEVKNNSAVSNDRMVVSYYDLTYPRKYNFNAQKNFEFTLPARPDTSYMEISNFSHANITPVLFDITNRRMMLGDVTDPSFVKIVLPPSTVERRLVLLSRDVSNIKQITEVTTKNFINYSLSSNQASYIIISNPILYNDGNGNNYVEEYRAYRASPTGGGYNAKIYDIQELVDQFAFGIKQHPLSIKNFLRFARSNFSQKPASCFLIGKGITYVDQVAFRGFAVTSRINLVPTFGWPASDNMLASDDGTNPVPQTPIGRLNVVYAAEIKSYLEKVKQYEAQLNFNSCAIADKAWMKNVMHIIGAEDAVGNQIDYYMSNPYTDTISGVQFGGNVNRFRKTSSITIQQVQNEEVPKLFGQGLSLVTYFGHSAPSSLQFSLDEPKDLKNESRYPFFIANGCNAGNLFLYDTLRLGQSLTLSERFVLTPKAGSIAFLASTHLGIVNFLHFYTQEFYSEMANKSYGKTFGEITQNTVKYIINTFTADDFYNRQHSEEITLHGDPAVRSYYFDKPDYVIEPQLVNISPQFISVAENSFKVSVKLMNIGKAVTDSIRVIIKRKYPVDGSEEEVFNQKIKAINYIDSIGLQLPIQPLRDKGVNKFTFTIDADNVTDEACESNNTIIKDVFIYENELRPLYPANYAIINKQNITFTASSADLLRPVQQYLMELDTTELFNSPAKVSANASSSGGAIIFTPSVTFTDGTVYYWRTGVTQAGTNTIIWNNSSFVYLANSSEGFNQSHHYQFQKSSYYSIVLDDADRKLKYKVNDKKLSVKTGMYPYFINDRLGSYIDFDLIDGYGCRYNSFQIMVLDGKTLKPWKNSNVTSTFGQFQSGAICQNPTRNFFEFRYKDSANRRRCRDFLNMIPDSNYVIITNFGGEFAPFIGANELMSDTSYLGSGNSLYHTFQSIGFSAIDSFRSNKPLIFVYKKNDLSFPLQQYIANTTDWLVKEFDIRGLINSGTVESPWFGPVKSWEELHWNGSNLEAQPDKVNIEIIGQSPGGATTSLAVIQPSKDTSISFIDASQYPFLKLKMFNEDTINSTPHQLQYWRLNATPLPEGILAPNITFEFNEVIQQGENISVKVAFKNISNQPFDSLPLRCIITDRNNVPHNIELPEIKPLAPGEVAIITFTVDSKDYFGKNTMYFMVNPDGIVPEQFLFNNFFYKDFEVNEDTYNPLLDVTFDGVHILNKDIVSSKPHIQVKLKDENKYLALSDTSLFRLQIRYPNGQLKDFVFNSPEVKFTPANPGSNDNTAIVDIFPTFFQDGDYELIVSGKDVNGNKAGTPYRVLFTVINKPMISNLLNYPNPFTSSTAFVFTVTGSEIPQNIRIQILTITGKVVREITKEELGPIHIGRNITEFKWDGTDMYGQKLANGVYLYRVITNLNGKSLEKYKAADDKTDKFFTNGYGKMYLMR